MFAACQEFQKEGSGWAVDEVLHLKDFSLGNELQPLKGSQYFELPKKIAKTNCILNIQNKDDKYFLWSILTHLHMVYLQTTTCPTMSTKSTHPMKMS